MGYALLHEAMLESVLYARDKYLVENGLMVPSHFTLQLAAFSSESFVQNHFGFWDDVYGFNMKAMKAHLYDEIIGENLRSDDIVSLPCPFLQLPVHKPFPKDILTDAHQFTLTLDRDADPAIDGFVMWFDTFFTTSADVDVAITDRAENWSGGVAFSTGPFSTPTHWNNTVLPIDRKKNAGQLLKAGRQIRGTVQYGHAEGSERHINMEVDWETVMEEGEDISLEKGKQKWEMP